VVSRERRRGEKLNAHTPCIYLSGNSDKLSAVTTYPAVRRLAAITLVWLSAERIICRTVSGSGPAWRVVSRWAM
jgi:hypothetical protein